jgi:hypothetical protein
MVIITVKTATSELIIFVTPVDNRRITMNVSLTMAMLIVTSAASSSHVFVANAVGKCGVTPYADTMVIYTARRALKICLRTAIVVMSDIAEMK